jgi:hypothetical protein
MPSAIFPDYSHVIADGAVDILVPAKGLMPLGVARRKNSVAAFVPVDRREVLILVAIGSI